MAKSNEILDAIFGEFTKLNEKIDKLSETKKPESPPEPKPKKRSFLAELFNMEDDNDETE